MRVTLPINGANVVTNAFPYLNMEEYADEVERQINAKAGAVIHVGSLKLGFPLQKLKRNGGLTGGGNKFSGRNYKPKSK